MTRLLPKLPAILLILGAILRVAGMGAAAIWFDEALMLYRAGIPFLTLFLELSEKSGNLLLEIILRPLLAISHSVLMLRIPSMIAGLVSLWLVWKLMQRLDFTLRQQITTSAIVACLPGLLWIAQDARSYSLLSCLFLAALWFALESQWLGLLAVCGLMIYTQSTGAVYAVAALVITLYLYPWKVKRILLVGLLIALAWLPAIWRIHGTGTIRNIWNPSLTLPINTLQAMWPGLWGWFVWPAFIVLSLSLLLLFSRIKAHGRFVLVHAWALPILGMVLYYLVTKENIIMYRTLMPILFPFSLWLGWELGRNRLTSNVLSVGWAFILVAGLVIWNPANRGGHLDQVANEIRSQWRTGDTLVYTTVTVGLPFGYYLGDLPHTWNDIIQEPDVLAPPSIVRTYLDPPTGTATRSWVLIPNEPRLITAKEKIVLEALVHHQEPIYTVNYMQSAQLNVYLVEEP